MSEIPCAMVPPAPINILAEIEAGKTLIPTLPKVLDFELIGSAAYLPAQANDVDFAVLIEPAENAVDYTNTLVRDGWGNCGDYDGVGGIWAAVRRENLNLMVTHDRGFFDRYKAAMQVSKALRLMHKVDRIAVCQIVRDGKKAAEVLTSGFGGGMAPDPALRLAMDALDEIGLAGMSGSGQESEDGMRDWHAQQAWKFIGIAARATSAIQAMKAAT